jgi:hydrogenase maturation protein HypF
MNEKETNVVDRQGMRLHISGIVQGVGFARSFSTSPASRWQVGSVTHLLAWTSKSKGRLKPWRHLFPRFTPAPASRPDRSNTQDAIQSEWVYQFRDQHSRADRDAFQPISPDVSICDDRAEFDPTDRATYPFINRTNCDLAYHHRRHPLRSSGRRPWLVFHVPDCLQEYETRQIGVSHAQPVACPVCGPSVWLESLL